MSEIRATHEHTSPDALPRGLRAVYANIVISANEHNPSIMHPAFLTSQEIVPENWELEERPVCTPVFSRAVYRNGIEIQINGARLQIEDNWFGERHLDSMIPSLAVRYISKLPHVPYTGIATTFIAIMERSGSGEWLIDRFIKPGPWNVDMLRALSIDLRFAYSVDGAILRLTLEGGEFEVDDDLSLTGVKFDGAYHASLVTPPTIEDAQKEISRFNDRFKNFISVVSAVAGVMER